MAERSTQTDLTYRPITDADEDFLAALYLEARDELTRVSMPVDLLLGLVDLQRRAQRAEYDARFPDSRHELIIVADEPVGHRWTGIDAGELRLLDLAIRREWQGRGIATAVLADLTSRAAADGQDVTLTVWSDNTKARRLYERAGFIVIDGEATPIERTGYLSMRREVTT